MPGNGGLCGAYRSILEFRQGESSLLESVDFADVHAEATLGTRHAGVEVRQPPPRARPDQGQEVGRQPRAAPAIGIRGRQMGQGDVDRRHLAQVACDAQVIQWQEIGTRLGHALAKPGGHEEVLSR